MTVKDLISKLEALDQDAEIILGVQGYTSAENFENEIGVYDTENGVYLVDSCFYEAVDA